MLEVCRLLTVEKKVSSVYHPQTNGMCEKFNGVLKRMLKAHASLEPKTWDKYLVYVLFAYREVPNDTTGFSPFELLYGRNVRGPLSVLKEQWEEPEDCQSSLLSYLIETRERLKMLSDLAHQNEMNAKQYRRGITIRRQDRERLKLWKGPYVVADKVGPVDYKVKVRGKEKVYHVNMLKTWYERPEALQNEVEFLACIDVAEDKFEDEYIDVDYKITPQLVGKETVNDVRISEDLTDEQHRLISERSGNSQTYLLMYQRGQILCIISASFVRLMRKVLKDCDGFADSFIDDIGIYSDTFEDHLKHIRLVLLALRKSNVAARPKKCCFGFSKLEFLGHIVGGGEIRPTQDKIQAIVDFKPPMTKKQVGSFIGLIGFYRKFISNFSKYSASITDLTKKGLPNKVKWTSEYQQCFDKLKSMIASEPVLRAPDFSLTFILCTNACNTCVGCVLEQEFKDGRHPILYE
ncbi:unnamed protein product [Mytilus coruscus]|uniref:Integrase catalytic domain-containing protein n=1 Tax=Mytilus coruscus TaxID=42192 RepID=A0A6J8DD31_MYTCO|nr:unnamed protein product [Mytilus coruscus]